MKYRIIFFVATVCAISAINANGQAVDSTGMDKLSGISTRVENFIPAAIPGPAGATGPAGPTGAAGTPGGNVQGLMCGIVILRRENDNGYYSNVNFVTSCQGHKIKYRSGLNNYDDCPAGYMVGLISSAKNDNSSGEGNSWNMWRDDTFTCYKT